LPQTTEKLRKPLISSLSRTFAPEKAFIFCIKDNALIDVIISNPPYQLSDGGAGASAMPIYQKFVEQAKKLQPHYITMIIPSRWFAGGRGLDEFRNIMRHDKHIEKIVDYQKSRECFTGVDIAGGVNYFLWNSCYDGKCDFTSICSDKESHSLRYLDEFEFILRDTFAISIVHKIQGVGFSPMSNEMLTINPFGMRSYERGNEKPFSNCISLYSSKGKGYVSRDTITKNVDVIDNYKICIGYLNPDRAGVNNASDGMSNVITKIRILKPEEIATETYIIPFNSPDKEEVINCAKYFTTKFARFLIYITLSSMHIAQKNLMFVPVQDFSKPWTDKELYAKYGLTSEEIDFIESMIRPMDLSSGGDD
jgi:site-specific DNA-methyltransferase (adenine-specific)